MDKTELIKIFVDRTATQIKRAEEAEPANVREEFALLNQRLPMDFYLRSGRIDEMPEIFREQAETVISNFTRKHASLFFNKVDYHVTENVFFWAITLFDYAKYSGNWNLIKDLYELFRCLMDFYSGTEALYVRPGKRGMIECRMKDEFPFVKASSVICCSHLNILWIKFLDNLKFLSEKFLDIKTDSRVEDLLVGLEGNFYPVFWDEGQGNLRFASDHKLVDDNSTPLPLYLFRFRMENLLYKQRKKAFLRLMESDFYTDKGFRLSLKARNELLPELLPVYWSALLRFSEYSKKVQNKVLGLIKAHIGSIHLETYAAQNWKYNRFMLEFLSTEKLDFPAEQG